MNWQDAPLASVVCFLEGEHHAITRGGLFRIGVLFTEMCRADGDRRLAAMRAEFRRLAETLVEHMEREELILFPAIVALEEGHVERGLRAIIDRLAREHEEIGRHLHALRDARDAFAGDERAPFARLFGEIEQLERHIQQSMKLENGVLFPRALAIEETELEAV